MLRILSIPRSIGFVCNISLCFKVESPDVLPSTEKATIEKDVSEAMTSNFRSHSMVAKYHEGIIDSDDEGPEESSEDDGSDDDIGHLEHAWEMLEMARMIWSKAGKVDLACEALHFLGEVSLQLSLLDLAVYCVCLGEHGGSQLRASCCRLRGLSFQADCCSSFWI